MLDICDLSEKVKVFTFIEEHKSCSKIKLYKQRVQDISTAYATVEWFFYLNIDEPQEIGRSQASASGGNENTSPLNKEVGLHGGDHIARTVKVNLATLPVLGVAKRALIKLGLKLDELTLW